MLTYLNKTKNALNGNFKPAPIVQCTLDSCYDMFVLGSTDRDLIEASFAQLEAFQKALKTIPKGRTFTVNTIRGKEIKLVHSKEGFKLAD